MTNTMPINSTTVVKYLSTFPPGETVTTLLNPTRAKRPPTGPRWRVTGSDYRGTVKRIVIAGGIGAGSPPSATLTRTGFPVVDADDVAHDVTSPASPTLAALVDGVSAVPSLITNGSLDRAFVAEVVFPRRLRPFSSTECDHPWTDRRGDRSTTRRGEATRCLPPFRSFDGTPWCVLTRCGVVVQVARRDAVRRLIDGRGFSEADAVRASRTR